jgi:hypothetical protein
MHGFLYPWKRALRETGAPALRRRRQLANARDVRELVHRGRLLGDVPGGLASLR